jgi:hypothetical protein
VSLDFMLDEPTGRAALIEVNPRPIGTTHLGRLFGHDPCTPLLARLAGEQAISVACQASENRTIALFPKEIERDPHNLRRLRTNEVYHDVPYDEPAVIAMYLHRLRRRHPKDFAAIAQAICAAGPGTLVAAEGGDRSLVPGALMGAFARYP